MSETTRQAQVRIIANMANNRLDSIAELRASNDRMREALEKHQAITAGFHSKHNQRGSVCNCAHCWAHHLGATALVAYKLGDKPVKSEISSARISQLEAENARLSEVVKGMEAAFEKRAGYESELVAGIPSPPSESAARELLAVLDGYAWENEDDGAQPIYDAREKLESALAQRQPVLDDKLCPGCLVKLNDAAPQPIAGPSVIEAGTLLAFTVQRFAENPTDFDLLFKLQQTLVEFEAALAANDPHESARLALEDAAKWCDTLGDQSDQGGSNMLTKIQIELQSRAKMLEPQLKIIPELLCHDCRERAANPIPGIVQIKFYPCGPCETKLAQRPGIGKGDL